MYFNRTNFVTATFVEKLLEAMRYALATGYAHYVENRHGQRWLRVTVLYTDSPTDRLSFQFLAGRGQNVGDLILQALFHWHPDHEREFSRLLGELYAMTEHPYTVNRRAAIAAQKLLREQEHKEYLKSQGITHSFRTPSGITYLGRWERSWWGRKRFRAIADATGKVFAKQFTLDREALLYGTLQGVFA